MGYAESIGLVLVLVCSVSCLPRPVGSPLKSQAQADYSFLFIKAQSKVARRDTGTIAFPKPRAHGSSWTGGPKNTGTTAAWNDSQIVFPDSLPLKGKLTTAKPSTPKKSKCTSTYCVEADDYPIDLVNNLLAKPKMEFRSITEELSDTLTNRMESLEGDPMCASREEIITPKKGLTQGSKWMFIVQDTKTGQFVQSVRIETCLPRSEDNGLEANTCLFTQTFPIGYRTSCTQKYIYKKLLAIPADGDKSNATFENFQLPSCCSCRVKVAPGLVTRGADSGDIPQSKPNSTSGP